MSRQLKQSDLVRGRELADQFMEMMSGEETAVGVVTSALLLAAMIKMSGCGIDAGVEMLRSFHGQMSDDLLPNTEGYD